MIKKFYNFINPNLILEDHRWDNNPGEDFGENWIKLDQNDRIYNFLKSKLPNKIGKRDVGIMYIYKVDNDDRYVAYIHGGENGTGEWKDYMEYLKRLFTNINDSWLLDLENDCADDVWTLRLAFSEK